MTTNTTKSISASRFEPWLDPKHAGAFSLTDEEREAGRQRREEAELAPYRTVQVRNQYGAILREEEIGGAISFVEGLVAVEATVEQAESQVDWDKVLVTAARDIVKWLPVSYVMFPTNSGKHRLARTENGMACKVSMLFVPPTIMVKGLVETEPGMIGRMGPLAQHLKPRISFKLGDNLTVAAGPDTAANHYRLFDSLYFYKASSLGPVESNVLKVYGTEDIANLARKMGHGTPDPVFKGVAIRIPDAYWSTVLTGAGLDPALHADVVACNAKDVKFLKSAITTGVTFWQVMPTLNGKVARVTSEERQLESLLPAFKDILNARRTKAAEEIRDAYATYAEGDPESLLKLVAGTITEMAGLTEEELEQLTDEEREEINTLFNSSGRIRQAIASGLPRFETEVIALIETLIVARIKGVNFKGITRFSLPSMSVSEFGCALKHADMKEHKLGLGDHITDIRYPNTGSGMLDLTLEFGHYLDGVIAHPETGKKFQSEDYDGDMSVVIPRSAVDNSKIRILAGKNPDSTGTAVTVGSVFKSSSFGKLHIGVTDGAITRLIANGREDLLPDVATALQALIDMAKKNVAMNVNANEILAENEVPATPCSVKILKGRIGTSALAGASLSAKKSISISYPLLLTGAWADYSYVDELVRPWITRLPLVFSRHNSRYTELQRAAAKTRHYDEPDALNKHLTAYEKLLTAACPEFIFRYHECSKEERLNFYERRDIPEDVAREKEELILGNLREIARDERAVRGALWIHAKYQEHCHLLNKGDTQAYQPIHEIKDLIEKVSAGNLERMANALKFLAWSILGANSAKVRAYCTHLAKSLGMNPIMLKSTAILASLPVLVGSYYLPALVKELGYVHQPVLKVLTYEEYLALN